ncbi:MAG: Gfo/Idh/MocA family oxidoreductase [Planctomycetaceae bacterium]|nr:Gfo/Idh/MocA family oxidoreductase [Planctomycetaceae bacterium]
MSRINRRQFLRNASVIAGGAFAVTHIPARAFGANDRVGFAIIGTGDRGGDHINEFGDNKNVQLTWVVDANRNRAEMAKKAIADKSSTDVQAEQDLRKMLDDPAVDAVSVATCNHWHSLASILALQAGKHVYVEKPCSQNLFEGRQLANAAAKYGKCVQHGTQRRSDNNWLRGGVAWASGKYGKPTALQAFANRPRPSLGFKPEKNPPDGLDWNLWIGPAAMTAFHDNLVPYNWHWFWNTGNGEIGNNGVHYFDLCRIALTALNPNVRHPQNVVMFGTRFFNDPKNHFCDQAETPNVQLGIYDYDGIPLIFESCNFSGEGWHKRETAYFVTEDGFIEGDNFTSNSGQRSRITGVEITNRQPNGNFGNFIDCVVNNTPEKLNAPIREGHYSASVCHLGNVSYRSGAPASLADCREAVGDNAIMQSIVDETLANLKTVFGENVDLAKDITWTLGQKLSINNDTEVFDGDSAATALLTRPERTPFIVPHEV